MITLAQKLAWAESRAAKIEAEIATMPDNVFRRAKIMTARSLRREIETTKAAMS